jgi:hypothetical protein
MYQDIACVRAATSHRRLLFSPPRFSPSNFLFLFLPRRRQRLVVARHVRVVEWDESIRRQDFSITLEPVADHNLPKRNARRCNLVQKMHQPRGVNRGGVGAESDTASNRIGPAEVQVIAAYLSTSWDVDACPEDEAAVWCFERLVSLVRVVGHVGGRSKRVHILNRLVRIRTVLVAAVIPPRRNRRVAAAVSQVVVFNASPP